MASSRFLFAALFVLSACKFEGEIPQGSQIFAIDLVAQHGLPRARVAGDAWPFIKNKTFSLRICPRDAMTLDGIPGPGFRVRIEEREQPLQSDAPECRVAHHSVLYNELAPENFVAIPLEVIGTDPYPGVVLVPLAFNPWSDQVIDLRYARGFATVSTSEAGDALMGKGRFQSDLQLPEGLSSNLVVESASLSLSHEASSQNVDLFLARVSARPFFRRLGLDGAWHKHEIARGRYRIKLALQETHPGETDVRTIAYGESSPSAVSDTGLVTEAGFEFRFFRAQTPGSTLSWKLMIEPVSPEGGLTPFIGVSPAESAGSFERADLTLQETPFSLFPVRPESLPAEILPPQGRTFRPRALGFRFKGVPRVWPSPSGPDVDPTTFRARLKINVEFCLERAVGSVAIAHHSVQITLASRGEKVTGGGSISMETDSDGCVTTEEPFEVDYDYFDSVSFEPFSLRVESSTAPFSGTSNAAEIFLNPWQQRNDRAFLWSNLQGAPPIPRKTESAQVLIATASSAYTEDQEHFGLDRQMNLMRYSKIHLKIEPVVYRSFLFGHENGPAEERQPFAEGSRLKLRLIAAGRHHVEQISSYPLPPEQLRYISGFEQEVVVEKGADKRNYISVSADLAHEFSEQLLFKSSFALFLELSPLDKSTRLTRQTFFTEFDPTERQETLVLYNSRYSIDELTEGMVPKTFENQIRLIKLSENPLVLKPKVVEAHTPYQEFLQTVHPAPTENQIDLSSPEIEWPLAIPDKLRNAKKFIDLVNGARENYLLATVQDWRIYSVFRIFAKDFCEVYASTRIKECLNGDPLDYVEFQILEFVEKVNEPPRKLALPALTFDRNRLEFRVRFFKERIRTLRVFEGTNNSENEEKGWNAHFGAERFGIGAGFSRGMTYRNTNYWASEVSSTSDMRDRYEVMQAKLLNVYETRLTLNLDVKTCLWVRASARVAEDSALPRFLLCDRPRTRVFDESWYSVIAAMDFQGEGQMIRDRQDPENRFVKLIRGSYLFREFFEVMGNHAKALRLDSLSTPVFGPTHLLNEIYRLHQGPFSRFDKAGGLFPGISRYRVITNPG